MINIKKECTYDNCGRSHTAKGYCKSHYHMAQKGIDLHPIKHYCRSKYDIINICTVEGCKKTYKAKGYCSTHYYKHYYLSRKIIITKSKKEKPICDVDNCDQFAIAKSLCPKHYQRFKRYGRTDINYKNNNKRTKYNINTTELRFTNSHEENMIMHEYLGEMTDLTLSNLGYDDER